MRKSTNSSLLQDLDGEKHGEFPRGNRRIQAETEKGNNLLSFKMNKSHTPILNHKSFQTILELLW
jgi:hypothetical protein